MGSNATYSLTWWTVDGGGASYRAAGSYTLGGTAGQPDAAAPRSGGVYTLRSGFWQPSCVAAAVVTTITRAVGNPNTVTLAWSHVAPNQTYQVHRATTPYFTPAAGTLQETVSAGPWSDDEVVIGDPNTNYFYLVPPPAARLTPTRAAWASSTFGWHREIDACRNQVSAQGYHVDCSEKETSEVHETSEVLIGSIAKLAFVTLSGLSG